jgi:hypothetical protein
MPYTAAEYTYLLSGGTIKYNDGTDQIIHHFRLMQSSGDLAEYIMEVGLSNLVPYVEEVIDTPTDVAIVLED